MQKVEAQAVSIKSSYWVKASSPQPLNWWSLSLSAPHGGTRRLSSAARLYFRETGDRAREWLQIIYPEIKNWVKWSLKKMGGEQEPQSGRKGCYYSTLCHPPLSPSVSTWPGKGWRQFPLGADINQTLKGCLLGNSWGKMERLITHIINFHHGLAHVTHMDLFEMGC